MLVVSFPLIAATRALPKELETPSLWAATFLPPCVTTMVLAKLSVPTLRWLVAIVGVGSLALGYGLLVVIGLMAAVV